MFPSLCSEKLIDLPYSISKHNLLIFKTFSYLSKSSLFLLFFELSHSFVMFQKILLIVFILCV